MTFLTCDVPGCARSLIKWKNQGCEGRKPYNFECAFNKFRWVKWAPMMRKFSPRWENNTTQLYVCDIHFRASDFSPYYTNNKKRSVERVPEHLKCALLNKVAMPSLFLDEAENLMLQEKSKAVGVNDWWRLSDNYNEKLDLDQLVKFNNPFSYKAVSENKCVTSVEIKKSRNQSSSLESVYDEDLCASEITIYDEVKLEEERSEEVAKKKRRLFRTLCTCPLSLPKHWAVIPYLEFDYVAICKVSFGILQGFVIERALRVTSDMKCTDIHVKGSDVTQLMQGQPLSCVADVEKLVKQVDEW